MGKLFGTDGIRGVANETLDTKLAYRIGQAAAISLQDGTGRKPTVVIGKDTRISSDMLEAALTAGLTACGCNVVTLGVIPTPAVAYLTVQLHADAGAVISASHNPYEHNGIKLFSREGFKLSDALEAQIEELILQPSELPVKSHGDLGQVTSGAALKEQYLDHLASTVGKLSGLRVLIDCANGAASATARELFSPVRSRRDDPQRRAERREHQYELRARRISGCCKRAWLRGIMILASRSTATRIAASRLTNWAGRSTATTSWPSAPTRWSRRTSCAAAASWRR